MNKIADQITLPNASTGLYKERLNNLEKGIVFSSFLQFVLGKKSNKQMLLIALLGSIIQITLFKILYPFPDFISDSYSYIETNLYHMDVNLWPIGYSKFLWLLHAITPSDTFLVICQYFIVQLSMAYFFFSILYLYGLKKNYANALFIFLFFNPLLLYLSNCVLSDTLFCSISLVLFTQYLWMYHQPKIYHIVVQAILIGLAFSIRYTAIYYPLVAAIAFLISKNRIPFKLAGIISPWIFIIPFILYTQQKTKQVTGTAEFSVFGGWQIANNALYMYGHIQVDSTKLPANTLALDRLTRKYFSIFSPSDEQMAEMPGTFFLKTQNAILKPYMRKRYRFYDAPSAFWAWGQVSPVYKTYGTYLIKHYPLAFARYYLWLNTKNYFFPHLEKFSNYNLGEDKVGNAVKTWFQLKSQTVESRGGGVFQARFFFLFIPFFAMVNLYFFGSLLFIVCQRKLKSIQPALQLPLLLTVVFLVLNFCFSVFATPVVLRYQIFPMILMACFSMFLMEPINQTNEAKG